MHPSARRETCRPLVPSRTYCIESPQPLPASAERVCFGVEDDLVEIDRRVGREEQIEILERLGKKEAVLPIATLLRDHALQYGVAIVGATVMNEVVQNRLSHRQVSRIVRGVEQVVDRLDDLRPQRVAL